MVDETLSRGGSTASECPWCSATYTGEPENCPSCGATLSGDAAADPALPGLTAIDAAAIVRAKEPVARPRNRLLSWISGDYPEQAGSPAEAGALALPDVEVRREILRLELEAEVANLQAEADALKADAAIEGHLPDTSPEDAAAAEAVVTEIAAVESGLDGVQSELEAETASEDVPPA
jgi:hypothetical protein